MTISSITTRSVTIASSEMAPGVAQPPLSSANVVTRQTTDEGAPSPERVAQALKQVNETFSKKGQDIYAMIEKDKGTGISVVKVMDKKTDEVISQFPSKEIIAIAEAIKQYQEDKGYLLDVSA